MITRQEILRIQATQCRREEELLRRNAQDWETKRDHYARVAEEATQQADVWRQAAEVIETLLSIVDVEPDCPDPFES